MAESVLSVCWKDHTSELATVYKSLLENNFLVDCTISAEGQNLKVHRLVLSASSPYFQELFSEETGNHPFVILLHTSFETLKAVIDFVYRGEAQIPEGNLKSFLTLAQSLKIKGLNVSSQDYENKNLSSGTTENVPQDPSEKNQVTCEVQGVNVSQEENNSRKHSHRLEGYADAMPTNSSVPLKEFSAFGDKVRSTSVMTPMQEEWRPEGCDDVSTAMEIPVKNEPVYSAFLEARIEKLVNIKRGDPMSGNFTSNMDSGPPSVCVEEDLKLFPNYNETSHGNTRPSELPSSQQQLMQLGDQMSSGQDVDEESESSLPVILVPKSEQLTDEENEEPMGYPDEFGNAMNERVEETGPASAEHNLDQRSRTEGFLLENDLATPQRSGVRLWGRVARESTAPLQLPEGQGEEPVPSAKGRKALASSNSLARLKPSHHRKHSCDACGASFTQRCHLVAHSRTHTGERPYRCDVCGKLFVESGTLSKHYRTHTGERPFVCNECGASFTQRCHLVAHSRTHTGERRYRCNVCGSAFFRRYSLNDHIRTHTGEQPYHCGVCDKRFSISSNLAKHHRTHTGERPFTCEVCKASFTQRSHLVAHSRTHTGERPYHCGVCGKRFAESSSLNSHYRTHTGERPFTCDVCGKSYKSSSGLKYHKRRHSKSGQ